MARVFSREQTISRLRETMRKGRPVIGAGAGCGIVAKCAELGGADLIVVSNVYEPWMLGLETRIVVGYDTNITVKMAREITQVVKETPLIAGLEASDPFHTHAKLLALAEELEFSGVTNLPTRGAYGKEYNAILGAEHVIRKEAEFLALARDRGLFTMSYVYDAVDAVIMAEAGVDCLVAHVGPTGGGLVGFEPKPFAECCRLVHEIVEAAQKVNPDLICLAHGGAFIEPEDTEALYQKTPVTGFIGESSIGRIPIERAVVNVIKGFKAVPFKKTAAGAQAN